MFLGVWASYSHSYLAIGNRINRNGSRFSTSMLCDVCKEGTGILTASATQRGTADKQFQQKTAGLVTSTF
jgi:hypothetical protein